MLGTVPTSRRLRSSIDNSDMRTMRGKTGGWRVGGGWRCGLPGSCCLSSPSAKASEPTDSPLVSGVRWPEIPEGAVQASLAFFASPYCFQCIEQWVRGWGVSASKSACRTAMGAWLQIPWTHMESLGWLCLCLCGRRRQEDHGASVCDLTSREEGRGW